MTKPKSTGKSDLFKVGDIVFYYEHDWKVAEILGKYLTLYRDRIDGRSETKRISSEELQEALRR